MSMSIYPSVLLDGEDAVVSVAGVVNATSNDIITVSCGPTNGYNDYLDYVDIGTVAPPFSTGAITNVSFGQLKLFRGTWWLTRDFPLRWADHLCGGVWRDLPEWIHSRRGQLQRGRHWCPLHHHVFHQKPRAWNCYR